MQTAWPGKVPLNFSLKTTVYRHQDTRSAVVQLSILQSAIVKCMSWLRAVNGQWITRQGANQDDFHPSDGFGRLKIFLTINPEADERSFRPLAACGFQGVFWAGNVQIRHL
ncbi:hypothetical protein [Pseudomonas nicosulfuronedens]